MADDEDNNATEVPVKESASGDIEQGRPSWVAAATAIMGSTVATSTALDGPQHVIEGEAALVPSSQPLADIDTTEITKGETKTKTIKNYLSTTPQQRAMEQIEDGDDAAPRPFDYAEFDEDHPKPKLDLGVESTGDDDGPPLPLTFGHERDSLSDGKKKVATSKISAAATSPIDGNESSIRADPKVGPMGQRQYPGDEENILQRAPHNHSAGENETARRVVSSSSAAAAERHPSVPVLEAYLVEEEEGPLTADVAIPPPSVPVLTLGGHDTVYEATPLEPDLPWWKQRRSKVFIAIIFALLVALALAVGIGVSFALPSSNSIGTTINTTAPNTEAGDSASSSASLSPSQSPTKSSYRCFADRNELNSAVEKYVKDGCRAVATLCSDLSNTYGWPIGSWCVSNVTDMSSLFQGHDTFNEDISMWNVSHVVDMSYMFKNATSFNQNLCAWQGNNFPYSSATDMFVDSGCAYKGTPSSETKGPFCASACNTVSPTDCFTTRDELKAAVDRYVQGYWGAANSTKYGWPIGSWCVGKVTDMSGLFKDLTAFNEDISRWEVGQVKNMSYMFNGASAFDGNISSWDTSAVTDMDWMFREASKFNQDLSAWNTSAVTTMWDMFLRASSFNQDLSAWNTSAVSNMQGMFSGASAFDGNISSWDTSAVTNMGYMFLGASAFDGNISSWDTSAVTDMRWMFREAPEFNQDLSAWNTSAVTTMWDMFLRASSFNQDLSAWNTSAVSNMQGMFSEASSFDGNISSWDTSAVTNMHYMFQQASAFNGNISSWDTSAVTDMSYMFREASSFNQDLMAWNTAAVTNMCDMFNGATSFNQNLCSWQDNFSYNSACNIFQSSGCTYTSTPSSVTKGPFCASDCTNNR